LAQQVKNLTPFFWSTPSERNVATCTSGREGATCTATYVKFSVKQMRTTQL